MKNIFFLFFVSCINLSFSQSIEAISLNKSSEIYSELIVRLSESYKKVERKINNSSLKNDFEVELLNEDLNVYGFYKNYNFTNQDLEILRNIQGVANVSYNSYVNNRTTPNDSLYPKQWSFELSKINKVWQITTGGKTYNNEEIVVGVLDDGIDIFHRDLIDNIFVNKAEIPDDGLDNDGNGVIDDVRGYNVDQNNGAPLSANHGTGVCGILGAKGNNNYDLAGVNWNIKILPVVGVNQVNEIIKAYTYFLDMKRLYISSKGAKGANILVSNYSGGKEGAFPNIYPYDIWCQMYDLLGYEGVLNVAAADNRNIDVAIAGDMPSTCPSEYLISVTNINMTSKKVEGAAYGKDFVALAAPGEDILTLSPKNRTRSQFTGTSASSPMVAGVAALLYAIPCSSFANLLKLDKVLATQVVKEAIRDGVKVTNDLKNITKWGGYLDAESAFSFMSKNCDGQPLVISPKGNLKITSTYDAGNNIVIKYITPDEEKGYYILVTDLLGRIVHKENIDVPSFGEKQFIYEQNSDFTGGLIFTISNGKSSSSALTFVKN